MSRAGVVACIVWLGLLSACSKPTVEGRESLGEIVDAEVVPTSFNESPKMRIKTTRAVVVIYTIASVDLGREAWSVRYSDGTRWVEWEGSQYAYRY